MKCQQNLGFAGLNAGGMGRFDPSDLLIFEQVAKPYAEQIPFWSPFIKGGYRGISPINQAFDQV